MCQKKKKLWVLCVKKKKKNFEYYLVTSLSCTDPIDLVWILFFMEHCPNQTFSTNFVLYSQLFILVLSHDHSQFNFNVLYFLVNRIQNYLFIYHLFRKKIKYERTLL